MALDGKACKSHDGKASTTPLFRVNDVLQSADVAKQPTVDVTVLRGAALSKQMSNRVQMMAAEL